MSCKTNKEINKYAKAKAIENNIFDAEETDNNPNLWDYFMSLESPKEVDEFLQGFMDEELEENQRSFDDIFADFVETDDSTEIKAYFKSKGKDAINKLKTEFPDKVRQVLSKIVKENQINEAGTAPDAKAVMDLIGKNTMLLNKLKMINNKEELQPVFDFLLTKINQTIAKNTQQVKTATTTSAQNYSKTGGMGSITEKDAPKLESLISKIMNETLSKKSAI
jgi:hypothetical protein